MNIYTVYFTFYGITAQHTCTASSVNGAIFKTARAWELSEGEMLNIKVLFEGRA